MNIPRKLPSGLPARRSNTIRPVGNRPTVEAEGDGAADATGADGDGPTGVVALGAEPGGAVPDAGVAAQLASTIDIAATRAAQFRVIDRASVTDAMRNPR